jgi:TolA-binding protein
MILLSSCSIAPLSTKSEKQLRKIVAELQTDLNESKNELARLNGKIEEVSHFSDKKIVDATEKNKGTIRVLQEQIKLIQSFQETQKILNQKIVDAVENNNDLIINIDKNYKNFRKSSINIGAKARLKKATTYFGDKEYQKSINEYSYFLKRPNLLSKDEYQIVLYRIALSEYRTNQNEEAIVHFSQIYEKFHKENDKYMASSLFHIGSILLKESKCLEAKKVFEQIKLEYSHEYFRDQAQKRIDLIKKSTTCKKQLS